MAACGVIVLWGHYKPAATVQLADGVNVYGCTTQPGSDALQVLVEAPPNGVPAMSAKGLPNGGPLFRAVALETSPIPVKYMLKRLGILNANEHRTPLVPALPEVEKQLDEVLADIGPA